MKLMNLTSNKTSDSSKTTVFSMEISLGEKDVEAIANKVAELIELKLFANTNIEDELLSVEEASVFLKRTRGTIYQLVNNSKHGFGNFRI